MGFKKNDRVICIKGIDGNNYVVNMHGCIYSIKNNIYYVHFDKKLIKGHKGMDSMFEEKTCWNFLSDNIFEYLIPEDYGIKIL